MFKQTVTALFLAVACTPALAIDYIVTRSDDPNPDAITVPACRPEGGCSLRQAILASNRHAGADRIVLRPATTYTLTRSTHSSAIDGRSGPLLVTGELEIVGAGSDSNRIEWHSNLHHSHSVLMHGLLTSWPISPPLALRDVTIANGRGDVGGCLRTRRGTELGLYGVVVENCRSGFGGGLHVATPSLVIYDSVIRNNLSTGSGGGIAISGPTTVVATNAAVNNNHANRDGGGLATDGQYLIEVDASPALVAWNIASGPTDFLDNRADGNGGAIAVRLLSELEMTRSPANTARANFLRNSAGATGGAISLRSYTGWRLSTLTLEDALLLDNVAAEGGALATSGGQTMVVGAEFQENRALAGAGGGVLFSATDHLPNNEIRQSSFNANTASVLGGAIASVCQPLVVRDSSLWGNEAPTGSAVVAAGQTALTHVTSVHGGSMALVKSYHTACGIPPFKITNSVIRDRCTAMAGAMTSGGGNFYGAPQPNCPFAGMDLAIPFSTFGLRSDTFGGERLVLGWDSDGLYRRQVNAGVSSDCSSVDVRGFPRNDGACDSGAFEQQSP